MSALELFYITVLYVCPLLCLVGGITTLVRALPRLKHVDRFGAASLFGITVASVGLHFWLVSQHAAICEPYLKGLEHGSRLQDPLPLAFIKATAAPLAALLLLQHNGGWNRALIAALLVAFCPPADVDGIALTAFLLGAVGVGEFHRQRHWSNALLAVCSSIFGAFALWADSHAMWSVILLSVVVVILWLPSQSAGVSRRSQHVSFVIVLTVVSVVIVHMLQDLRRPELFAQQLHPVLMRDVPECMPPF